MNFVIGNVYVVFTTLTRDRPKDKYVLCVLVGPDRFVWINTDPSHDGLGQVPLATGEHDLVTHDSFVDLGRLIMHSEKELARAVDHGPMADDVLARLLADLDGGGRSKLTRRTRQQVADALRAELERRAAPPAP